MSRIMSFSGSFYPDSAEVLESYFEQFNSYIDKNITLPNIDAKAIIVPHAGYVYSGFSANIAYRVLSKSSLNRFIVIAPSHRVGFEGFSVAKFNSYQTPFGDIDFDSELYEDLSQKFNIATHIEAHAEHSSETQFPFIKFYKPDAKILELVYSYSTPEQIAPIIEHILSLGDVGVIISTDLSHFYSLSDAKKLDSICLDAVASNDIDKLHSGCEACGIIGVEAMMIVSKKHNLTPQLLDYRTSADFSNDESRVVGYMSAIYH